MLNGGGDAIVVARSDNSLANRPDIGQLVAVIYGDSMTETHLRTCPLCEACCGLEITTDGDQVVRIRGDMSDPYSRGFICPKGSTLKQLHEDPDRLTEPVIRTGDGWKSVTWDEAFAEIERRIMPLIEKHGRSSLGVVLGNPNVHNLGGQLYMRPVIAAAATTNLFSASTVDQMPKHVTAGLLWGRPDMFPLPDVERTDYLLMMGANPYASNGSLLTLPDFPGRLRELRERGGRFVVVDPRRTKTAENADEHLRIVPGTDVLWQLAIVHTLFDESLVGVGRLDAHVSGIDEVRNAVREFSPESIAERCGIDAETTRRITREFAAAPSAAAYGRMGAHTNEYGALSSWATDLINTLTGNLDRPGGVMFNCAPTQSLAPSKPGGRGFALGRWHGSASGRGEVKGELPAATLADEILADSDERIRALVLLACNPVRSFPNSDRLDHAFDSLDFLVAVDPYINASSRHANVILPPTSALERSHYDFAFEANMIRVFAKYSPAVFSTDGLPEEQILARLSLVLGGFGATADPQVVHDQMIASAVDQEVARSSSPIHGRDSDEILEALRAWSWSEQFIDLRLRGGRFRDGFGATPDGLTLQKLIDDHPHGRDYGHLEPRFPDAIKTASGTVELASPPLMADLDRLRSSLPGGDELVLVGRRDLRSCNTWMHNVNVLIKGRDRCTLQLHPDDAARLGLETGARATISSRVGSVTAPVEVTDELMVGVVSLPFGWGHDEPGIEMHTARTRPGVNSNALTDDTVMCAVSGNAALNAIPVEVVPA